MLKVLSEPEALLHELQIIFSSDIICFLKLLSLKRPGRGSRVVLAVLEHQLNFHDFESQSINKIAVK